MSSTTAIPGRPTLDARQEIITFNTQWGRYPVIRAERYRLAVLHRLAEAEARRLAYGGDRIERPAVGARPATTYSADILFRRFDADGRERPAADRGPILPRAQIKSGADHG